MRKGNISRQEIAARLKANFVNLKTSTRLFGLITVFNASSVRSADLHPIIEIEPGYFFGISENGNGST